ncbi:MAG: hypothetical protein ABWX84_10290 [Nocardioides sp.]
MRLSRVLAAVLCLGLLALLPGCTSDDDEPDRGTDWSPRPQRVGDLSVLATSDASGYRLHTASGDKGFLPGVNLGSTTPLHQPGEIGHIGAAQYRTWLEGMGDLGVRVVRIYTLPPPAFYDELATYNLAHADRPIYLFQGIYLPNEEYIEKGRTLYDEEIDGSFAEEIEDISDAVHGDLIRKASPGRAGGTYGTDVSSWLAGWIIGVEWDPQGVTRTDRLRADAPYTPGRFFRATPDATATERWIATHMDSLARHEAARGASTPIAMANWPTGDPLDHPEEPLAYEDTISVDANHVLPTKSWPGGTFASFHAYPYYPDFQRYEPGIQDEEWNGEKDPYAGYVVSLRDHYAPHMPLMVTEFGVPASLGTAHYGNLGRDQGGHSEQEAMAMDADMMRMLHAKGIAGAFVFVWEDEWFKRTWNTTEHQDPERRQLWHDPLTNEQWFGLVATDPDKVADAAVEVNPPSGALEYLYIWADASWVHVDVTMRDALPERVRLEADVVPGRHRADYRVLVDRAADSARLEVRRDLDVMRLDTSEEPYHPEAAEPWHLFRLLTNRSFTVNGVEHPAEYQDVGDLHRGTWDPADDDYDSTSTWRVDEEHRTVSLRIPWSMLGLADPSSRTALGEGKPAEMVQIEGIGFDLDVDGTTQHVDFRWPTWNFTGFTAREKSGIGVVAEALGDLAP